MAALDLIPYKRLKLGKVDNLYLKPLKNSQEGTFYSKMVP